MNKKFYVATDTGGGGMMPKGQDSPELKEESGLKAQPKQEANEVNSIPKDKETTNADLTDAPDAKETAKTSFAKEQDYKTSLGEYRVGVDFNPSGKSEVNEMKSNVAYLINKLEKARAGVTTSEQHRCISEAQTALEAAAMWAVKALTKGERS